MKSQVVNQDGRRIWRVIQGQDAEAARINLLTIKGAARYKRSSSLMEDKDADDEDPDH